MKKAKSCTTNKAIEKHLERHHHYAEKAKMHAEKLSELVKKISKKK